MGKGRPKLVDLEVRASVSSELKRYFDRPGESKADFARRWNISRVMLHRYLKGVATPSPEVLAKLLDVPGLDLRLAGKRLKREDFPQKPVRVETPAVQLALDFDEALTVTLGPQNLTVTVTRRPAERVEIRLDVSTAA